MIPRIGFLHDVRGPVGVAPCPPSVSDGPSGTAAGPDVRVSLRRPLTPSKSAPRIAFLALSRADFVEPTLVGEHARMRLGDIANAEAAGYGKPLDGIRILAAEQMQALPFATQLLARLGADVVKVEHPVHGESGRQSSPAMLDPDGRAVGATYLRNNLNKRSVGLDLKAAEGREVFLQLATRFDVVCENFKAGTADRLGIGYDAVAAVHPTVIYLSLSGFGNDPASPYIDWPAYASVVEAMSGVYAYKAGPDHPPTTIPVGALGDISTALFATVGILAALRHRDRTGEGQRIDMAMLDAMIAMTDVVTHFWSLGVRRDAHLEVI